MAPPLSAFLLASFVAFFVTVNPIKSAAVFAALTERSGPAHRRSLAIKSVAVAAGILVVFTLFGDDLLRFIGISLPGVRVGGGILLMLVSIDIVFGRSIGPPPPAARSGGAADIAVFGHDRIDLYRQACTCGLSGLGPVDGRYQHCDMALTYADIPGRRSWAWSSNVQ